MKIYGAEIAEGSQITNITVAVGTAFPVGPTNPPNDGELFYISGGANAIGLYVYFESDSTWHRLVPATEAAQTAAAMALALGG